MFSFRIHDEYSNKVIHHKTQVLELEKTNPIQLALAKQEILLDQLQAESNNFVFTRKWSVPIKGFCFT